MSAESSTVSVELLRQIMNRALDHVRDVGGDTIELEQDFFWSVPPHELYDVYIRPEELTIGQITESWGNLTVLQQDGEPVTAYVLVWVADVLRALGHQLYR